MRRPLKFIRESLGITQEKMAELLTDVRQDRAGQDVDVPEVTQQALSRAEAHDAVSADYARLVKEAVLKHYPDQAELMEACLYGTGTPDSARFALPLQREREFEFPEGDAWSFALPFRSALILDRIASLASAVGPSANRLADGVVLTGCKVPDLKRSVSELLYASPPRLGLEPGMVILIGDPSTHRAAAQALDMIAGYMVANRWELKIGVYEDRYGYFGYPARLKSLRVNKRTYAPQRYVDDDGCAMCYEDFGVIFSAGLGALNLKLNPFGEDASHLILIFGLHRLATGVGVKLLEELDLRKLLVEKPEFSFPSGSNLGVLAFRVVLRTDNRLWVNAPGFKWTHTEVKEFEVLANWQDEIKALKQPSGPGLSKIMFTVRNPEPAEP